MPTQTKTPLKTALVFIIKSQRCRGLNEEAILASLMKFIQDQIKMLDVTIATGAPDLIMEALFDRDSDFKQVASELKAQLLTMDEPYVKRIIEGTV